MRFNLRPVVLIAFLAGVGCAASAGSSGGTGGSSTSSGAGGSSHAGTGGSGDTGGSSSGEGSGGSSGGGTAGSSTGGTGGDTSAGGTEGTDAATTEDAAPEPDGDNGGDAAPATDSGPASDAGPTSYQGEIPPYEGPPVPPEVKMDCPGDPTAGFTEYKDTFHVERPYDLPISARFSIDNGIYTFWVMHGDKKHDPASTASNPRTEARYSQLFKTGIRMWSADIYWEKSVTNGSVVMQVHTTSTGIGPVYMVANGSNVSPINASKVPGGLIDHWINMKVLINADTTASQYWINNCPVATQAKGTRGDGNDYFKMGVYHCDSGLCRDRYKNVHLYMKM